MKPKFLYTFSSVACGSFAAELTYVS